LFNYTLYLNYNILAQVIAIVLKQIQILDFFHAFTITNDT